MECYILILSIFTQARLLIGVGRYSEMTYVFDTLRAHQQIDMLLRRGVKVCMESTLSSFREIVHKFDLALHQDTLSMVCQPVKKNVLIAYS